MLDADCTDAQQDSPVGQFAGDTQAVEMPLLQAFGVDAETQVWAG